MNDLKRLFGLDKVDQMFVGFDDQLNRMIALQKEVAKNVTNYPPYNIRKTAENKYLIELAVAGFGKQDIEIELADNKLVITGAIKGDDEGAADYLVKGIGMRAFTRVFAVEDKVEVQSAELVNGMLKIALEKFIPEEKKPKKVKIKSHDYRVDNV